MHNFAMLICIVLLLKSASCLRVLTLSSTRIICSL